MTTPETRLVSFRLREHLLMAIVVLVAVGFVAMAARSDLGGGVARPVTIDGRDDCCGPALFSPVFFRDMADRTGQLALVALGFVVVSSCRRMDLSVGAVFLVSVCVMRDLGSPAIASAVAIFLGLGVGMINGFLVAKSRHSSTMITLLTMLLLCGLGRLAFPATAMVVTPVAPPSVVAGVTNAPLAVAVHVQDIFVLAIYAAGQVLLLRTQPGRNLVFVGRGYKRARLLNVNVAGSLLFAFCFSGVMAAIAGLFGAGAGIVGPAGAITGASVLVYLLPFQAFAAVAIGHGDLRFTRPRLVGVLVGCFLLQFCSSVRRCLGWPVECDTLVVVSILLVGTLAPTLGRRASGATEFYDDWWLDS